GVCRGEAGGRDQGAAEGWSGDHAQAAAEGRERRHGRELFGIDEPRRQRLQRGPLQTVEGRHGAGDRIEDPDGRPGEERGAGERGAAAREPHFRPQDQAAAVDRIREGATHERRDEQGEQLGQAEQAHGQRRARELEHLIRQGHIGDHAAQQRDELRGVQRAVVAVAPEGSEVHSPGTKGLLYERSKARALHFGREQMPKNYTMGGRAGPSTGSPGLGAGPAIPLPGPQSMRERFGALRNLPPFLKLIWQTSRALTTGDLLLRLVRALLPVATLYVGKLIIDQVILLTHSPGAPDTFKGWLASGRLDHLGWLLAAEFSLAVLSDLLGRIVSLFDSLLSEQFTNATSVRLMEHAATLDLEDFEDSELQDKLERARRQTTGRMTLMGQLFGQAQYVVTIISFAAGLVVYAPWLIALLILALVPAFLGEAHFNAQSYSLDWMRTPERREIDYVRQTGASVETAKEVKIFGLNAFLIERYRQLADALYQDNR